MIVAIDTGGRNTSVALFLPEGKLARLKQWPTPQSSSSLVLVRFLEGCINAVKKKEEELDAIGIGICGVIKNGTILFSPNMGWRNLPLKSVLEQRFQAPTSVINDADAFALGTFYHEFAGEYDNICAITLGTGLGGAIIGGNGLFASFSGTSPEIGHITLVANGRKCSCGKKGCFEAYVSERALIQSYRGRRRDEVKSGLDIYRLYKAGDEKAKEAFEVFGHYLGIGLSSIANIFAPQAFVLGGGLSKARMAFLASAERSLRDNLLSAMNGGAKIVFSRLLRRASILGAYHSAKEILRL